MLNPSTNKLRHSIRAKIKIEKKKFGITTEYYYQPNIKDFNDCIIYGTTKLTLFPTKPFNFIIQDQMNFRSTSDVRMMNNLTFGIAYKFIKKIVK
jgi:cytochrome c2